MEDFVNKVDEAVALQPQSRIDALSTYQTSDPDLRRLTFENLKLAIIYLKLNPDLSNEFALYKFE